MMDEKLMKLKPYGYLYTALEVYLLMKPEPICKDSWQGDNCYRFLVTPNYPEMIEDKGGEIYRVYGYLRHIVTNHFTIEYRHDLEEITVPILDEIDLTEMEIKNAQEEQPDDFPF